MLKCISQSDGSVNQGIMLRGHDAVFVRAETRQVRGSEGARRPVAGVPLDIMH